MLFGKSLKETNLSELPTWPEYRTKSFQGTRVILEFIIGDKQYVLARHINYKGKTFDLTGNSSVMLKDLTGLDDGLHKSDVQAEIDRLLEISPKTFLNSVLFGQRMTKFIQADNADKATIFSKFFDVDYIDKAKDRATDEADVLKAKISNYTSSSLSIKSLTQRTPFAP